MNPFHFAHYLPSLGQTINIILWSDWQMAINLSKQIHVLKGINPIYATTWLFLKLRKCECEFAYYYYYWGKIVQ